VTSSWSFILQLWMGIFNLRPWNTKNRRKRSLILCHAY